MQKIFILTILFSVLLHVSCTSKNTDAAYTEEQIESKITDLIGKMSLEEKISLIHANSKFAVAGLERLGIPEWWMSDGPHGVRQEIERHSWSPAGWTNDSSTYFPTLTALGATWNRDLAYEYGKALGEEARFRKKDVLLGPGVNIMRTPLCGRNFEYMGEDPKLISEMIVNYIKALQEQDVAACIKHYALNNQEFERDRIDVYVDERALREIYLPVFEAAVKEAGVLTVMCAYNKFRGQYCSENDYLQNKILKGEWGFGGVIISDWAATHSTVDAANNGLDIEMGTTAESYDEWFFADPLIEAVKNGIVKERVVDDKVRRRLRVMFKTNMFGQRKKGAFVTKEHQQVARNVAAEAVVLLKNETGILPLNEDQLKSIAVIGDNATRKHAQGGYSSSIKSLYEISPLEALKVRLKNKLEIKFAQGYEKTTVFQQYKGLSDHFDLARVKKLRKEAVQAAKEADAAIVFAGLNHDFDTEAGDRPNMKLPYFQDELIRAVKKANKNTIVVLISGSPVEMPWVDEVPAILQGWLNGQEAGNAITDVLFGRVNPSGKLPFTFPEKLSDSPAHATGSYPGENLKVNYKEGLLVGYRYFDTKNVDPLFCFGHGLSYTSFTYSDLSIKSTKIKKSDSLYVELKVKNSGTVQGAEVVQCYLRDIESSLPRPYKELKGFTKVRLNPGEKKTVSFVFSGRDFSFYDAAHKTWRTEPGQFELLIGSSSRDIRLRRNFEITL